MKEYLIEFDEAKSSKRFKDAGKKVRHHYMFAGAVAKAVMRADLAADLIFVTINLRPNEAASQVLQNIRREVCKATGTEIGWAGVSVPGTGGKRPKPPHIHVVLTNVELGDAAWNCINKVMDGRNRRYARSCHMCWAFNHEGLEQYLANSKNLGRRGAKVISTRDVRDEAEKLYSEGAGYVKAQSCAGKRKLSSRFPRAIRTLPTSSGTIELRS